MEDPWPADPNPDLFQPNLKKNSSKLFFRKFQYTENYDIYDTDEKDKIMYTVIAEGEFMNVQFG